MMGVGGEAIYPPFLTSALDRREWLASRLCRFNPQEDSPIV
jgi:hypothetical protein